VKPAYHSIVALEDAPILQVPESVAGLDFLRGTVIVPGPPPAWVFDIEIDGAQLPHLLGGRIPMASERLLGVLVDAGVDNIQTFSAELRFRGGAAWRQHAVFNVIGLVAAADLEASVGTILAEGDRGPTLMEFGNLVLSRTRTLGLPLFRLFHDPARLLMEDRLLRALKRHTPAEGWGFSAVEVEVSDPPAPS
jgi:hypothetical protein